jgi:hypothetical protein
MDLYADAAHLTPQLHGYDPGITPSPGFTLPGGLFWIKRIPKEAVDVHLGDGRASMHVKDLPVLDWGSNGNSISGGKLFGKGVPATVSFDIQWSGITRTVKIGPNDVTDGFAGLFQETGATMSWSSKQDSQLSPPNANTNGFMFVSDPAGTSKKSFAEIGHDHNGSFLPGGDDDG